MFAYNMDCSNRTVLLNEQRCNIKGTVIGMRTRIGDGAVIEDSVVMGSDVYPVRTINHPRSLIPAFKTSIHMQIVCIFLFYIV